jgi:hypothetical protein
MTDESTNAQRLATTNTVFDAYAKIERRTRTDGTSYIDWRYEEVAFHERAERPNLPCPGCENVKHEKKKHEESRKKQKQG